MARSLEPQPVLWRRIYIDLPTALADGLKIRAAEERVHMKNLLTKIVTQYLEDKQSGKTKK